MDGGESCGPGVVEAPLVEGGVVGADERLRVGGTRGRRVALDRGGRAVGGRGGRRRRLRVGAGGRVRVGPRGGRRLRVGVGGGVRVGPRGGRRLVSACAGVSASGPRRRAASPRPRLAGVSAMPCASVPRRPAWPGVRARAGGRLRAAAARPFPRRPRPRLAPRRSARRAGVPRRDRRAFRRRSARPSPRRDLPGSFAARRVPFRAGIRRGLSAVPRVRLGAAGASPLSCESLSAPDCPPAARLARPQGRALGGGAGVLRGGVGQRDARDRRRGGAERDARRPAASSRRAARHAVVARERESDGHDRRPRRPEGDAGERPGGVDDDGEHQGQRAPRRPGPERSGQGRGAGDSQRDAVSTADAPSKRSRTSPATARRTPAARKTKAAPTVAGRRRRGGRRPPPCGRRRPAPGGWAQAPGASGRVPAARSVNGRRRHVGIPLALCRIAVPGGRGGGGRHLPNLSAVARGEDMAARAVLCALRCPKGQKLQARRQLPRYVLYAQGETSSGTW